MHKDSSMLVHEDSSMLQKRRLVTHLTTSLGFLINWDKSDIVPSKEFVYLGVRFNLQAGMIYPSKTG